MVVEVCFQRTISLEGDNQGKIWHGKQVDQQAAKQPYGTGLWRSIRNLWPKLMNNCKIKVGDGRKDLVLGGKLGGSRKSKKQIP